MDGGHKALSVTAISIGGIAILFICLIAYLLTLPFSFFTTGHQDLLKLRQEYQGSTGGGGALLAAVAMEEYQHYGNTACGSRYWPNGPEDWCCYFVYWCAGQLGYVGSDGIFGSYTGYCPAAIANLHEAGAEIYYPTDGVAPQPGDIIFFSSHYGRPGRASDGISDWASHIGIVVEGTNTTVTVVEGNTGGGGPASSRLSRNTYQLTSPCWSGTYILSFWRPRYPAGSGGWFNLQGSDLVGLSHREYIEFLGPLFIIDYQNTGLLASVSMAQFILESGWEPSGLLVNANNAFGMKAGSVYDASAWDGTQIYRCLTQEYVNGHYVTVTANWRKYASVDASIADHSAMLCTASRYAGCNQTDNYREAIEIIWRGGYATSPNYVQKICAIIEENDLTRFDIR